MKNYLNAIVLLLFDGKEAKKSLPLSNTLSNSVLLSVFALAIGCSCGYCVGVSGDCGIGIPSNP